MSEDAIFRLVIIGGGMAFVLALVAIHALKSMHQTRAREETKREMAAYVAEGSIAPDDAAALLIAGDKPDSVEQQIANAVAWGMISSDKAEDLLRAARRRGGAERPVETDRPPAAAL